MDPGPPRPAEHQQTPQHHEEDEGQMEKRHGGGEDLVEQRHRGSLPAYSRASRSELFAAEPPPAPAAALRRPDAVHTEPPTAARSTAGGPREPRPSGRPGERPIDTRRYRKVRWFVVKVFLQALWWDLILNRPGLRRLRSEPIPRYREIARRYRALAVEMGGVLIKLGQFLSIRADLLPPEVTGELAGLQDEVPPEPREAIVRRIEEDFGCPSNEVFAELADEPVGAASLAQVHRARLTGGEEVVVKVLRPGIEVLVETDLAAVDLALRWLRWLKRVRRRVDLDRVAAEFRRTTLAELDLVAEAANAERFAEMFADDPGVRVPAIFRQASAAHTLTLEDVGFIKIADAAALAAAGIDAGEVARRVYRAYMEQIFVHNFVHADPHPGNLFVEPLPTEAERQAGREAFAPGETPPPQPGRPFRIVFVDFGMTAVIPPRLRGSLREYLLGLSSRDAARVVRSYQSAGVLLPEADLERLEEVHREIFDRFFGVPLGELREVALSEARFFLKKYRDLIYEMPFQVQVDLLFVSRAVGILSGLSTRLDPRFDPWAETLPFAERLAAEEARKGLWDGLAELVRQGSLLLGLPESLESVLGQAADGRLVVRTELTPESRAALDRLERTGRRLTWVVTAGALLVAGIVADPGGWAGGLLLGLAAAAFLWSLARYR
jgi:predicted unusual protein kinase regulating ubiquinone biosynthesis (AarF/ABC1/UbiB family)